jgi:hypothetical protein
MSTCAALEDHPNWERMLREQWSQARADAAAREAATDDEPESAQKKKKKKKKKKKLVGNFKNTGQAWVREPIAVNVHDFPGDALGRAVPYEVYDLTNNRGFVYLGSSGDTPAIAAWWQTKGRLTWSTDNHLLLLADAGGGNSCHTRAWKERVQVQVQVQVCDRFGLTVTVCHYPTGCSKWNPIERRLFSHISNNWAGVPLRTWDALLAFIRGTTTAYGLTVQAIFTGRRLFHPSESHRCGDGRPQYRTPRNLPAMELHSATTDSSPNVTLSSGSLFLDVPLVRSWTPPPSSFREFK